MLAVDGSDRACVQSIITGARLLTFWKKTIRPEYFKYDLVAVQRYLARTVDGKMPSGTQRDDMIHECKVMTCVERMMPVELDWWQANEEAKANGDDEIEMPATCSGGRTWLIMTHLGPLGEGINELRSGYIWPSYVPVSHVARARATRAYYASLPFL